MSERITYLVFNKNIITSELYSFQKIFEVMLCYCNLQLTLYIFPFLDPYEVPGSHVFGMKPTTMGVGKNIFVCRHFGWLGNFSFVNFKIKFSYGYNKSQLFRFYTFKIQYFFRVSLHSNLPETSSSDNPYSDWKIKIELILEITLT